MINNNDDNIDYSNKYYFNGAFYKYTNPLIKFFEKINNNSFNLYDNYDNINEKNDDNNNIKIIRLFPKNTSFTVVDNNVVLLYPDINYEFKTFQNKSLIETYKKRFVDLYCCCFNSSALKIYMYENVLSNKFISVNYPYDGPISCEDISENECLFFKRFYCRALRDLVGPSNMSNLNSYCSCDDFNPKNRVLIKMGVPYNCINKDCDNFYKSNLNNIKDKSLTSDTCNLNICENTISLSNVLVESGINIENINMNLYCQNENNREYI